MTGSEVAIMKNVHPDAGTSEIEIAPLETPPGSPGVSGVVKHSRRCPNCAQRIKPTARVCRWCSHDLSEWMQTEAALPATVRRPASWLIVMLVAIGVAIMVGSLAAYVGHGAGESAGFTRGLEQGERAGQTAGLAQGTDTGYTKGRKEGYTAGFKAGKAEGLASGKEAGLKVGKKKGYESGFTAGKAQGNRAGYSEGCLAVFNELGTSRLYYDFRPKFITPTFCDGA